MVNWEASTSSSNGHLWSSRFNAMSCSMSLMSLVTAFLWGSPQVNLAFFLSKSVSGHATSANPDMKGRWSLVFGVSFAWASIAHWVATIIRFILIAWPRLWKCGGVVVLGGGRVRSGVGGSVGGARGSEVLVMSWS
jgi:hypothetical protein